LKGTSRFGAELDSLADFVDFGVAPALVLYFWALHEHRSIGWFAALIFAIAGALRLARFNVMIDDPNKPAWSGHFFVGMPAPAGAVLVMLPMYLHFGLNMANDRAYVPFEIAYVLFIAFLMASRIPHFSGKQVGRVPREWFIPVLLGILATLLLIVMFPMQMLCVLSLSYLLLIPFSVRRFLAYQRADELAAEEAAAGKEGGVAPGPAGQA
jgi:CDP-diacylglycerol--serine O-phosphatidyltransferase